MAPNPTSAMPLPISTRASAEPVIDLRHEREARGLSLDDVAERARIPRRYIEAMEAGDTATLPPGPFLRGYRRQYLEFLDLPSDAITTLDEVIPPETTAPPELPVYSSSDMSQTFPVSADLPIGKLVVAGFVLCAVVVLGLKVGAILMQPEAEDPDAVPLTVMTTQRVSVQAIENTRVDVFADDSWHHQGTLPGGESVSLESTLPIEVTVSDLTQVHVHHNGELLVPLHDLSAGRKLVFLPAPVGD